MHAQSLTSALVSSLLLTRTPQSDGFVHKGLERPKPVAFPSSRAVKTLPITCRLSYPQARQLAVEALLSCPLPQHDALMAQVQAPEDIYISGLATANLLAVMNQGASEEQVKQNHLKALFLRDKIGQRVVNECLKTWQDKLLCFARVLHTLPDEAKQMLMPKQKPSVDRVMEEAQGPFSKQDARQLANHFLRHQPLENRDQVLKKIRTFNDMVMLDREACRLLAKLNRNQPKSVARENTMNYLFLMHHTGVQITNRFVQTPADKRQYWQHLWDTLKS